MIGSRRTGMVDVRHLPQQAAHWSGPAAVRMALVIELGPAAPSQWRLAQDEHLNTSPAAIDPVLVTATLNTLMPNCRYTSTDVGAGPGPADLTALRTGLMSSIDDGRPIVAALRMHDNVLRPPGYPDRLDAIEHTVLVFGYADGGEIVRLADPAGRGKGVEWAGRVPPKYSLPTSTLLTLMAERGYVAAGSR